MQQSVGEDESKVAENLRSVLATHPPIQQWSRATVEGLKSAVNSQHAEAEWHEESIWTRNLINAVLALNEGWNWQRLRTCSNTDYFSLPTHASHQVSPSYKRIVILTQIADNFTT